MLFGQKVRFLALGPFYASGRIRHFHAESDILNVIFKQQHQNFQADTRPWGHMILLWFRLRRWEHDCIQAATSEETPNAESQGFPLFFRTFGSKKSPATSVTVMEIAAVIASNRCDCKAGVPRGSSTSWVGKLQGDKTFRLQAVKLGDWFFYQYWCWRAGGAAPVKTSTGNNFPKK